MKAKSKFAEIVGAVMVGLVVLMVAVPVLIAWFKIVVILWRWAAG